MSVFKIRNKESGLFSTGGEYPRFNKTGKAWSSMRNLRLHLSQFVTGPHRFHRFYDGCEIVELVIKEQTEPELNIHMIYDELIENRRKKLG